MCSTSVEAAGPQQGWAGRLLGKATRTLEPPSQPALPASLAGLMEAPDRAQALRKHTHACVRAGAPGVLPHMKLLARLALQHLTTLQQLTSASCAAGCCSCSCQSRGHQSTCHAPTCTARAARVRVSSTRQHARDLQAGTACGACGDARRAWLSALAADAPPYLACRLAIMCIAAGPPLTQGAFCFPIRQIVCCA